jgi:hypothetical protein
VLPNGPEMASTFVAVVAGASKARRLPPPPSASYLKVGRIPRQCGQRSRSAGWASG